MDAAIADTHSPTLTRDHINGLLSKKPYLSTNNDDAVKAQTYAMYIASGLHLVPYKAPSLPSSTRLTHPSFVTKSIDTSGATPCTLCNEAKEMILRKSSSLVAVIMADTPNSVPKQDLFKPSKWGLGDYKYKPSKYIPDSVLNDSKYQATITDKYRMKSPIVARLYARHTYDFMVSNKLAINNGIKRFHLSLIALLMTYQGYNHLESSAYYDLSQKRNKSKNKLTLKDVENSPLICRDKNDPLYDEYEYLRYFECARLSDGITVYLIASKRFIIDNEYLFPKNNNTKCDKSRFIEISAFGEGSNCIGMNNYVDKAIYEFNERLYDFYPMKYAVNNCLQEYILNYSYKSKSMIIDWFGIYDCFPIAFIVHMMAARIVNNLNEIPQFLEKWYQSVVKNKEDDKDDGSSSNIVYPINTHGGLLGFGAPGAVPAAFSLIEAVRQLRGEVKDVSPQRSRQVNFSKYDKNGQKRDKYHALVTANGLIFGQAGVVLLTKYLDNNKDDQGDSNSNGDSNGNGPVFEIDLTPDFERIRQSGIKRVNAKL